MTTIMAGPAIGHEAPVPSMQGDINTPLGSTSARPGNDLTSRGAKPNQAKPSDGNPGQAGASQPKAQSLEAVTVTGSLISAPNQTSASPIVTAGMEELKKATGSVAITDILNQLPQFAATSSRFVVGNENVSGIQTINLRGLGSNRNLVMLDGRRLPLADRNGDVAISLIPEAAIGRVDVITGGASAVYGSDAISGVVNFHTVPYFEGIKATVQYGDSFKGDFPQQNASVALGSSFGDGKGHVLLAFGYAHSAELTGTQRDFFQFQIPSSYLSSSAFQPAATNLPSQSAVDALYGGYGISTPIGNTLKMGFNDDGTLFTEIGAKNYKGPTSGGYAIIDGNVRMPVGQQYVIASPLTRKQAFSKFEYDFNEHFEAYGQFMLVKSHITTNTGASITTRDKPMVPVTNPFIPSDLRTLLASRPNPDEPFAINTRFLALPFKIRNSVYQTSQFIFGVKGSLAGDWTYDAYVSHGKTTHNQMLNAVLNSRVQDLVGAPDGGNSICAGGYNPFGVANNTSISQDCVNYMTTVTHNREQLGQNVIQATVQGSLFNLPAGALKMAVRGDVRRDSYGFAPDTEIAAGNVESVGTTFATSGSTKVKELAVQFRVPILSDLPLAKRLIADTAYRYSKYDIAGSVDTYEADLKWRPVGSFLVRAGFQRAIRAPNVGELFSAPSGATVGIGTPPAAVGDPCDVRSPARTGSAAASVRALCLAEGVPAATIDSYVFPTTALGGIVTGNRDLSPEQADTRNIGLQWTSMADSALLSTMSLSLDYWDISIEKVISSVPGTNVLAKCYNLDGSNPSYSPGNPFCQLIQRDAQGALQQILLPYQNLGSLKTDGVDFSFGWSPALESFGVHRSGYLFFKNHVGYTRSFDIQTIAGGPIQDYVNTVSGVGTVSHPRWKAVTTLGFGNQNFTVGIRWNYLGAMDDVTSITSPNNPAHGVPSYSTYDLFGSYFINDNMQIRAGITDLTDKKAIPVATSEAGTVASLYNPIGRSYFVGLDFSL